MASLFPAKKESCVLLHGGENRPIKHLYCMKKFLKRIQIRPTIYI